MMAASRGGERLRRRCKGSAASLRNAVCRVMVTRSTRSAPCKRDGGLPGRHDERRRIAWRHIRDATACRRDYDEEWRVNIGHVWHIGTSIGIQIDALRNYKWEKCQTAG